MDVVMDSGFGKSIDRISDLPDAILVHILSFLPTKYAVGTSILSQRWKLLWTLVPCFDFHDRLLFHPSTLYVGGQLDEDRVAELNLSFMNFVNRVLLLSDVSYFQELRINLEACTNHDFVNTWICAAIKHKVQELNLLYFRDGLREYGYVRLPFMVFTSKTLVVLALHYDICIQLPDSVGLPSLKILRLGDVTFENEDSLPKLLSGCPILEDLWISRWNLDIQLVWNVFAPTVKQLTVLCYLDNSLDSTDEIVPGCKLVVEGPHVEELILRDYVSDDFILNNLSSLSKATIEVGRATQNHIRCDAYGGRICKLLKGIAHVKSLKLHIATLAFLSDYSNYVLPTFHNLTCLELYPASDPGWNLLMDLLECSPNLAVLILEKGHLGYVQENSVKCWNSPRRVPNCLLLHLKEIKIQDFHGLEYEIDGIEFFLKNGSALKKMTIDCRRLESNTGFRVWRELAKLPKSSKSCELNLPF